MSNLTPDPHETIVSLSGVQKSYDGQSLVVDNLDLDVKRGEFLTMLGPSGSGKTTTLMMIAGFETPTRGTITLNGLDITRLPPHKRGIGMVFQNYALFPHMTVAENVAYPLTVRGLGAGETQVQVRDALAMVRLETFGQRRPAQLSGGQQQRVALARALVFRPDLVLLDEPLGALDKKLREQMQFELKQIHDELGVTMIYVTHDQSEALTMSDRIAVFDAGRIQQLASPVELYEQPVNAFVADFVGENNRLKGVVSEVVGDVLSVRLSDGSLLQAHSLDKPRPGEDVLLSIRPEKVIHDPEHVENVMTGKVVDRVYLGETVRIVMRIGDSDEFVMKADNGEETRLACQAENLTVGWKTRHCQAFRIA